MAQIPSKLNHGDLFRNGVFTKINQIIDYLKTQRIVSDNNTIKVNQLSSGISLSVPLPPTVSKSSKGGGGIGLCKIVSVPSSGFGFGVCKKVIGYTQTGEEILAEEETPIYIPFF